MHTEHLQNVRPVRVISAWLVAVAMTSLLALALISAGLMTEEPTTANTWWSVVAVSGGFFAGGLFAGFRAIEAPVLHALGIGFISLVAWALLNALASLFLAEWYWPSLTAQLAVALLLTQFVAAAAGALVGHNVALRGRPGLAEQEPL